MAGTYFAQAREYKREAGRFISEDLIAGFADMPFSMNRYGYCFNNGMVLMDLDGAWPSWNDVKNGIKEVGQAVGKTTRGMIEEAKNADWKKIGRTALNIVETVGAVAAGVIAVGTVGAIVGTGAAIVAGVGIAANAAYTGYINQKNGGNFFDGLFVGSLNASASVFASTFFGAPLPQNHIGSVAQVVLTSGANYVSGTLSSLLLDAINQKTPDAETAFKNGISQAGVAALLGGFGVKLTALGQSISALASLLQQYIMNEVTTESEEDDIKGDFVCEF